MEICKSLGGHLVTVESAAENKFLFENFAEDRLCWLGGAHEGGKWRWITGESINFSKWAMRKPPESSDPPRYPLFGSMLSRQTENNRFIYSLKDNWSIEKDAGGFLFQRVVYPLCEWE